MPVTADLDNEMPVELNNEMPVTADLDNEMPVQLNNEMPVSAVNGLPETNAENVEDRHIVNGDSYA